MRLTNNQIALVAILFMVSSLVFNTMLYQRAAIMVTGKSTVDAHVSICINRPPVLSLNCLGYAKVDFEYSCDVDATDEDNNIIPGIQNLTFSDDTSLFDINSSTGMINFTPNSSQAGVYAITITAEDNSTCANSVDSDTFTLTVFYCGDRVCNGDETCNTCSQDCGACPTTPAPSAGGGGGGAARIKGVSKKILLELSAPPSETLFSGDEIEILVKLKNKGDVALYNIELNVETDAPNVTLALSDNWFSGLIINGETQSILKIRSLTDPKAYIGISRYSVTLNASVLNPEYSTSIRFFIDLKERDYETRIETLNLIQFAQDLFKQNPECLEFNEILEQAQEAYDNSDYDKATSLINSAIRACRDLISLEEEEKEKLAPRRILTMVIFIIEILFLLILVLAMLYYYYKKRKEKRPRMPITKKSDLELKFDEAFNRTKKFMRSKDLSKARTAYLSLCTVYNTIRSSSLRIDVKSDCYQRLSKVYSKLFEIIKKYK